ncbi:MAG: universal stress protein, partial [Bacteroidia bacterium]
MHILCPIDFSYTTPIMLQRAVEIALHYGGKIRLLYVVRKLSDVMAGFYGFDIEEEDWFEKRWEDMKQKVFDKLAAYKQVYIPSTIVCEEEVRYGKISEEIIKEAEVCKANCIILAMQTADELAKVPLANRVTQVISAAPCPVLTYHTIAETSSFQKILYPITTDTLPCHFFNTFHSFFQPEKAQLQLVRVLPSEASEYAIRKSKATLHRIQKELQQKGISHIHSEI